MTYHFTFFMIITHFLSVVLSTVATPIPLDANLHGVSSLYSQTTHSGRGTFFYPGMGNCGGWNDSDDPIIAISTRIYHEGSNCDQWVQITNTQNSKKAYGLVRDSCPSCSAGSLDMSPAVFKKLAPLSQGVIPIQWHFMSRDFSP